jgi:hypothetical protein
VTSPAPPWRFARAAAAALAIVTPPSVMWKVGAFEGDDRFVSIVLLLVYEFGMLVAGVTISAAHELKERWTRRLVDHLDAVLQQTASRFDAAYLKYVTAAHSYIDLKGLSTRGEYTLSLDEVFVQLSINAEAVHSLTPDPLRERSESQWRARSIWHWMSLCREDGTSLAIIGPPGSGKTTLLKHVAHTLSARRGLPRDGKIWKKNLPVLISLRDYRGLFVTANKQPDLVRLIRLGLKDVQKAEPPGWTESRLRRGRLLVMLDGLDELADAAAREAVSKWVDKQRESYPGILFVVTSRPFGYKSNPLAVATLVQVNPFTEAQVSGFLRAWYVSTSIRSFGQDNDPARLAAKNGYDDLIYRLKANAALLAMAVNPLLLTMIANVHHYRGALPGSRAELYSEICEVFLAKRHQARGVPVDMSAGQKQLMLQILAFKMMKKGVRDIGLADAGRCLTDPLARVDPALSVVNFLRRVEESSGLLIEREVGSYAFAHFTFQEFLASCHIKENRLVRGLCEDVSSPWWRETALLYAAQADATPIIVACLNRVREKNLAMLALAVDCAEEAREVGVEARRAMESLLNPPQWQDDPESRIVAGIIRLLRRARTFERVSEDVYVRHDAVSNSEYQAFVDLGAGSVPDHWCESVCADEAKDLPIDGLRFSDAMDFCGWAGQQHGDGRWYSPPLGTEPQVLFNLDPSRFELKSYWLGVEERVRLRDLSDEDQAQFFGDSADHGNLDAFDRLQSRLSPHVAKRIVARTRLSSSFPNLLSVIARRLDLDRTIVAAAVGPECRGDLQDVVLPLAELGALPTPTRKKLNELKALAESGQPLDVEVLQESAEGIARLLYRFVEREGAPQQLMALARTIQYACSISLNRSVPPRARCGDLRMVRAIGRLATLAAVSIYEAHEVTTGERSRRGPRVWSRISEMLISTLALLRGKERLVLQSYLTSSLDLILLGLILLEARIDREHVGSDGLVLVRRAAVK